MNLQVNRHLPTQWRDGEDGSESVYWMTPEVAQIFTEAKFTVEG